MVLIGNDIVQAEELYQKQMMEMHDGKYIQSRVYKVKGFVKKSSVEDAPSNVAILDRQKINPAIFEILVHTKFGKGGEIQLTDALKELAQYEAMYAYNFEGRRYDVGYKQGFIEATVEFALIREDLREEFLKYLSKITEEETKVSALGGVAVTDQSL